MNPFLTRLWCPTDEAVIDGHARGRGSQGIADRGGAARFHPAVGVIAIGRIHRGCRIRRRGNGRRNWRRWRRHVLVHSHIAKRAFAYHIDIVIHYKEQILHHSRIVLPNRYHKMLEAKTGIIGIS